MGLAEGRVALGARKHPGIAGQQALALGKGIAAVTGKAPGGGTDEDGVITLGHAPPAARAMPWPARAVSRYAATASQAAKDSA